MKPDTVQIDGEVEASVTGSPELAVGADRDRRRREHLVRRLGEGDGLVRWSMPGVTAFDGAEAGLGPIALVALTVNVYEVPLVRPVTMALDAEPATVAVLLPGVEVTV